MIKLDKKDRKILSQLETDGRKSHAQIGKKVGLSREVVSYRINRLEKSGLIDKYVTILNPKKIGYESYKWYLQLENTNSKKLEKIIESLVKHQNSVWINTCAGKWDLAVVFFVKSSLHFDQIISDFLEKYGEHIRESTFTIELDIYHFRKKLFQEKPSKIKKIPYVGGKLEHYSLKETEVKILTALCTFPRKTVVDISKETNLTIDVIRHTVKKLIEREIIQGTRVNLDNSKLGMGSYKILLSLKRSNKERESEFVNYLQTNSNVWDVIRCLGNWNLEINLDVENSEEFHKIVLDIKDKFPDLVKGYELIQLFKNHKYNFFPMGTKHQN